MTFLMMIAVSIGVGWFAQKKHNRVGVKWALGTFGLIAVTWVFLAFCIGLTQPGFLADSANSLALSFLIVIVVGAIMGVTVATLPEKE